MTDNDKNLMNAIEREKHAKFVYNGKIYRLENALDLINRQQAEIERLNSCVKSEDEVRAIMKAQMEPMVKEITNEQIDLANKLGRIDGILKFAEMLKDDMVPNIDDYYIESFVEEYIDNLVKEMVGE